MDNYGSILLHLSFFFISPESHYLMPVTISQALTVGICKVTSSAFRINWESTYQRGKIKLRNEGNSSDGKEIVYYFKIMTDRAQENRAEGIKTYVCHVSMTNNNITKTM